MDQDSISHPGLGQASQAHWLAYTAEIHFCHQPQGVCSLRLAVSMMCGIGR
jgi:hypothetical protein